MSDFWKSIKNIFKAAEESTSNQPVIHEVIKRSEKELADYERWKETVGKRRFLDWLRSEHSNYKKDPHSTDAAIDFLNTPSTKGFVIHFYRMRYNNWEIIHFFDFLKEQVLALDYKSYLSDTRTYNRKDWVERTDRHYLKPPTNIRNPELGNFDQRFGNITIEIVFRNEKIYLLKFSASIYKDRLYKEAEEFDELLKAIYF